MCDVFVFVRLDFSQRKYMSDISFVMDFRSYNFKSLLKCRGASEDGCLYISTFNIDLEEKLESLINSFDRVVIVINPIPLGRQIKDRREEFNELNISNFSKILNKKNVHLYFNRFVHAKIIATQSVSYVGSANFSLHSVNNIESGYVSRCVTNNKFIISKFEEDLIPRSISVDAFLKSIQGENKVQEAIKNVIKLYGNLIKVVGASFSSVGYMQSDRGDRYIHEISSIIEVLDSITKVLNRDFDSDILRIEEFTLSASWEGALADSMKSISILVKESARLRKRAEDDDLYDTLTFDDYNKKYGEGTMAIFERHRNSFETAEKRLQIIKSEIVTEIHSIRSYLFSLSTLRKDFRDNNFNF